MDQALVSVNHDVVEQQLTAVQVRSQVQLIQEVMHAVMQEGYHYGVIPGTDKPTLLKPGAEKLGVTFRLAPKLRVEIRDLSGGHREVQVTCELWHIPTNRMYGEGVGSCSTLESKYRYRNATRKCPHCEKEAIIKGKAEYGGGWICFARKGGCGAKFADDDQTILGQEVGKIDNPDIADMYNTVLKMAKKRALVDATLTATAASDCFTQDLEDFQPEPASFRVPPPSDPDPKPTVNNRQLTKGQQELLLLAARRAKVTTEQLEDYLEKTYHIAEARALLQKDLNAVLEWLEASSHRAEEAGAVNTENEGPAHGGTITEGQRKRLYAIAYKQKIGNTDLHRFLSEVFQLTSVNDVPAEKYELICQQIEDGAAVGWLTKGTAAA